MRRCLCDSQCPAKHSQHITHHITYIHTSCMQSKRNIFSNEVIKPKKQEPIINLERFVKTEGDLQKDVIRQALPRSRHGMAFKMANHIKPHKLSLVERTPAARQSDPSCVDQGLKLAGPALDFARLVCLVSLAPGRSWRGRNGTIHQNPERPAQHSSERQAQHSSDRCQWFQIVRWIRYVRKIWLQSLSHACFFFWAPNLVRHLLGPVLGAVWEDHVNPSSDTEGPTFQYKAATERTNGKRVALINFQQKPGKHGCCNAVQYQ